ncbi:MAG: hypothetical protein V4805_15270 [Pseudomonadota bacterium]
MLFNRVLWFSSFCHRLAFNFLLLNPVKNENLKIPGSPIFSCNNSTLAAGLATAEMASPIFALVQLLAWWIAVADIVTCLNIVFLQCQKSYVLAKLTQFDKT